MEVIDAVVLGGFSLEDLKAGHDHVAAEALQGGWRRDEWLGRLGLEKVLGLRIVEWDFLRTMNAAWLCSELIGAGSVRNWVGRFGMVWLVHKAKIVPAVSGRVKC